jgi:membrane protease subunit HflK
MAWNEPGGSGNKDPWGNRGGSQRPPDLDEVVKKLQDKFSALFGGKKPAGGGRGTAGGGGSFGVGVIIGVVVAIWFFSGVYIVDEGKRGVVLQFGKYAETTLPGPHWYPRFIQSVDIIDIENIRSLSVGFRSAGAGEGGVSSESLMLTQDENIVDVRLAVQYKVKSASDFLFNVKDPEITLHQLIESTIREIIGKSNMDFILTGGRAEITALAQQQIQDVMDRYGTGLLITSVNMQDAQPPEQVQEAFADAVKAQGDQERVINEAQAYANDILPKARGNAARQLSEANAYKEQAIAKATGEAARFEKVLIEYKDAPLVTRKRLYLETVESVLSNSSKVMVDVKGGNNILYLPLDRIIERSPTGAVSGRSVTEIPGATAATATPEPPQPVREDIRSREVR